MILTPNDSPISNKVTENVNFGINKAHTTGEQQKSQDYLKPSGGSPNTELNPVDETLKDVDDMSNTKTRKREFSRRHETQTTGDHNKERFHESDFNNRPKEDDSSVIVPDDKHHGSVLKYHFGEGQYEGEIN